MKQTKSSNQKILLFVKVPPPVTGATLMNCLVVSSEFLKSKFHFRLIKISYAKSVSDLGKQNLNKLIGFVRVFITLLNECTFHRPRFVYFQISNLGMAFYRDFIFILLIKLFKIKIVYHLHGKGIKQAAKNRISKLFYTFAFKNSEIICLSKLLVNDIEDVFEGKIHIVNNGIPDNSMNFINHSLTITDDGIITILFLSNLIQSKGILDFIEGIKILAAMNLEFKVNIVGEEGDIKADCLLAQIDNLKLTEKVFYLGPKYNSEKWECISKSDVMVFPTKNDAWGNVILEAMQFGIPVIATREGAIPEIIDDKITGFLIEKNSPAEIADKIKAIILNPKLRYSMGAAGRKKYVEKYTLSIFEKNLGLVFNSILRDTN